MPNRTPLDLIHCNFMSTSMKTPIEASQETTTAPFDYTPVSVQISGFISSLRPVSLILKFSVDRMQNFDSSIILFHLE